jgi:hypothetical protein
MDTSSWVAAASLLAALLSALYARWMWGEARRTNFLALHTNRIDVFRAFNSLRQAVQEQGNRVELQRVSAFFHASQESKFYFSEPKTSQLLGQYFDTCFALTEQARKLARPHLTEAERNSIEEQQDILSAQEQALFAETEKQLEKELCGAVRRKWCCA